MNSNILLNNLGYTTYYTGAPENITESERIYLVKNIPNISLTNLREKVVDLLQNSGSFSIPEFIDNGEERYFFLDTTLENVIDGFDTIIYFNNDGPVGYTTFYDEQKIKFIEKDNEIFFINSINIYIDLDITSEYKVGVRLNNSLLRVRVEDEDSDKILIEDTKPYNFLSIPRFLNHLNKSDNYLRYTSLVSQAVKDNKLCIVTDTLAYNNGQVFSYNMPDFNIKRNPHPLDIVQFGMNGENLFIYQWNDNNEFCIDYLNIFSKYGNPKELLKSSDESKEVMTGYKIHSMSKNYIILLNIKKDNYAIYNIKENYLIDVETNMGVFIDPLDSEEKIVFVDKDEYLINSIKSPKISQELCGIFLNVRNKSRDYYIYDKIGTWFVFKSKANNQTIYSNIYGTLTISDKIKEKPVLINDRCILLQDEDECKFFFFDGNSYKYISPESRNSIEKEENVYIVSNKQGKINQLIEGFRHNPIGESLDIPMICYSAFGTLYYIENNKFKRL